MVSSLRTAPSAHGAKTSASTPVDAFGVHGHRPELGDDAPHRAFVDVGDEEAGAGVGKVAAQGMADTAQTLHGNADAG